MTGAEALLNIIAHVLFAVERDSKADARELLARLRAAIKKARETGDTSDLESIRDSLTHGA